MREFFWRAVARFLANPARVDAIIERGLGTPYGDIRGADDGALYMRRWWLFNRYDQPRARWREWLPSVRLHLILKPDSDRHMHDHPWNARSIILRGHYFERREGDPWLQPRLPGTTTRLLFGQFHRIAAVSRSGVWTLFITWRYRGTWGFKVDGRKVPHREYLKP